MHYTLCRQSKHSYPNWHWVTCILCGKCEMALWAHGLNPGILRYIFETMCEGDSRLRRHFDAQRVFKRTSSMIQNELLNFWYEVYREEVAMQVAETLFVAVQVDDVSCKSQLVLVLRYVLPNNTVRERHLEMEVKDKRCLTPSKVYRRNYSLGKSWSQYDGVAMLSGNVCSTQTLMKETYPNGHFVHCNAHKLSLGSNCALPGVFFSDLSLTAFVTFLSGVSKTSYSPRKGHQLSCCSWSQQCFCSVQR